MIKKLIIAGLMFSLHVPIQAMEESEEATLDEKFHEAGDYLGAISNGTVKGFISLYDIASHPLDNVLIPIGSFINDVTIIEACRDMGLLNPDSTVDCSVEFAPAQKRMGNRAKELGVLVASFIEASNPERLEMLTAMGIASFVPGTVVRGAWKMGSNKYKFGMVANPDKFQNLNPADLRRLAPEDLISLDQFRNQKGMTYHKYAVTVGGKLFISRPIAPWIHEIKHPDLVNGKNVVLAGEIFGLNGKGTMLTDASGHFKPFGKHLEIVAERILERHGYNELKGKFVEESTRVLKYSKTQPSHAIKDSLLKLEPTPILAALIAAQANKIDNDTNAQIRTTTQSALVKETIQSADREERKNQTSTAVDAFQLQVQAAAQAAAQKLALVLERKQASAQAREKERAEAKAIRDTKAAERRAKCNEAASLAGAIAKEQAQAEATAKAHEQLCALAQQQIFSGLQAVNEAHIAVLQRETQANELVGREIQNFQSYLRSVAQQASQDNVAKTRPVESIQEKGLRHEQERKECLAQIQKSEDCYEQARKALQAQMQALGQIITERQALVQDYAQAAIHMQAQAEARAQITNGNQETRWLDALQEYQKKETVMRMQIGLAELSLDKVRSSEQALAQAQVALQERNKIFYQALELQQTINSKLLCKWHDAQDAALAAVRFANSIANQGIKTVKQAIELAEARLLAQSQVLAFAQIVAQFVAAKEAIADCFAQIIIQVQAQAKALEHIQVPGWPQDLSAMEGFIAHYEQVVARSRQQAQNDLKTQKQKEEFAVRQGAAAQEAQEIAQRLIKAQEQAWAKVRTTTEAFVNSAGVIVPVSQLAKSNQDHAQAQAQLEAAIKELAAAGAYEEAVQALKDAKARADAARKAAAQEVARQAQVEAIRQEYIDATLNSGALCDWFNNKKKQNPEDFQVLEASNARFNAARQAWEATPEGALDKEPWRAAVNQEQARSDAAAAHAAEERAQKRKELQLQLLEQSNAHFQAVSQQMAEQTRAQQRRWQEEANQRSQETLARLNAERIQQDQERSAQNEERLAREREQTQADSAARLTRIRAGEEARRTAYEAAHKQTMDHYAAQSKKQEQEQADRRKAEQVKAAQAAQESSSSNRGASSSPSSGTRGNGSGVGREGKSSIKHALTKSDSSPAHFFIDCDTGRYKTGRINKDGSLEYGRASSSEYGRSACDGDSGLSSGGGSE